MKYITLELQNEETTASFVYGNKSEAMAKFHHEMEYACNAGITTLCLVVDSNGRLYANEKYTAPAPAEGGEE